MTSRQKEFSKVDFATFVYKGVPVHPPSAYTSGHRDHLGSVAARLGRIYITFLHEFPDYFRYTLFCLREELIPSAKIARIILNKKIAEQRYD